MENDYVIKQLKSTKEEKFNLERLNSLKDLKSSLVFSSTMKCLEILDKINPKKNKDIIYETLLWMDVAKTGTKKERKDWEKKGYNLFSHNIGSSDIYKEHASKFNQVVYILIRTHGLIGQHIRGELNLSSSKELYSLIENKIISKDYLKDILLVLNECIIREVSDDLYEKVKQEVYDDIEKIIDNKFDEEINVYKRLCVLNNNLVDKDKLKEILSNKDVEKELKNFFKESELWYYYSALKNYDIDNQVKILLIISKSRNNSSRISFYPLMKNMYLDYKNIKRVNIYKLRIIENYLNSLTYEKILSNNISSNINISYDLKRTSNCLEFNFVFSTVATKLIEFCEVAYTSDSIYNKSVLMLYDLFGFRKDKYDRFYNEIEYLQTMNSTIVHKAKLLDFIVGKNILDVGPGGGALMDLIIDTYPDKKVFGIDISQNVIEELEKKKIKEKKDYTLVKGNALCLEDYFKKNSIDTIVYSSIIHELFSYIEYNGKKFNYETIKTALKSAYNILPNKGRIIIRDGIKTEKNEKRIIEFKNRSDLNILKRYKQDFKGRDIKFDVIDDDKVIMNVNDAMEFLYTYTWGENSYPMEVQEQFGYFTPKEYIKFVKDNLEGAKIIYSNHFLQEGYSEHLLPKINFYDENYNTVNLPDSTFILVIEKEL